MAEAKGPVNKYQIMKKAGLAKQTTYNAVQTLKLIEWIRVASSQKTRTGLTSDRYELTELGKYRATQLIDNPSLVRELEKQLGEQKFKELYQKAEKGKAFHVDEILSRIREVLIFRKARPNYRAQLMIKANNEGRVAWSWKVFA